MGVLIDSIYYMLVLQFNLVDYLSPNVVYDIMKYLFINHKIKIKIYFN